MPGLNRRSVPTKVTSVSPRSSGHIKFADTLVTGISRQAFLDEDLTVWDFEYHALQHECCRDPYSLAQAGRALCSEGRRLAIRVAELLFQIRSGDKIFHHSSDGQEVRIELQNKKYKNSISLLWAIREYGHGILNAGQPSYDRTYYVEPRLPSRHQSARYVDEPVITYSTRTIAPPNSRRHKSHTVSQTRGSLYALDEAARMEDARRERSTKYNLEVREPHYRRYHR